MRLGVTAVAGIAGPEIPVVRVWHVVQLTVAAGSVAWTVSLPIMPLVLWHAVHVTSPKFWGS